MIVSHLIHYPKEYIRAQTVEKSGTSVILQVSVTHSPVVASES
jgi:hypothetical protein